MSRVGAASHQFGQGSHPGPSVTSGLSSWFSSLLREFFVWRKVTNTSKLQLDKVEKGPLRGMVTKNYYLFIIFIACTVHVYIIKMEKSSFFFLSQPEC